MFADILVVLAVAITALDGKRRGLVKTFLGLFGTLAAAIAASFLKKPAYEFLNKTPLFENLRRSVESGVSEKFTADGAAGILSGAAKTAGDAAGSTAADIILPVISAVMVFIAVIIAFKILGFFLDGVVHLPVLKRINSAGGLILGVVFALLLIYAVFALWGCFTLFEMPAQLTDSVLAKSMFSNNILLILFSK